MLRICGGDACAPTLSRGEQFSQKLVERDRQVADALAGGVEHRVGDRGGDAGDADLADAARAQRRVRIGMSVQITSISGTSMMHRHVIFGEAAGS